MIIDDVLPVMVDDALTSSHPIIVNVSTPAEITSVFDSISYSKVHYTHSAMGGGGKLFFWIKSFNRLHTLPTFALSQKNAQSDVIFLTKMQLVLVCVCREPLFSGCWKTGWVKTCSETAVE